MAGLEEIVGAHSFFAPLPPERIALVAGCARNRMFNAGQYLFHESDAANEFFVIRSGRVALEIAAPGQAPTVFATLGEGEVVGVTWLIPPYHWTFDARAMELTRTIGIDAACLRGKCEADPVFGYQMMKLFLAPLVQRLHATRLQILDVYGRR
jgi:CRP/FNR family transcriptional regulator, cyclic AMP receptor protein